MKLEPGLTAVVTGGASGIGFGIATSFARRGLNVVLADIEEAALHDAVTQLGELGGEGAAIGVRTDVSSLDDVQRLSEEALERFGALHVVCNNAGVVVQGRAWELSDAEWRWVFDVNLLGVVHGIRTFVPLLVEQGSGHVVNTASMAALTVGAGNAPYCAAKHGVLAISEVLALDLETRGANVGVSVYCPGFVRTRIVDAARNRPASAGDPTPGDDLLRENFDRMRMRTQAGLDPLAAGELVAAAVADRSFWIFNDDASLERVRARLDSVLDRQYPALGRPDAPR